VVPVHGALCPGFYRFRLNTAPTAPADHSYHTSDATTVAASELLAPAHWRTVDFVSDMHLQASERATVQGFLRYLLATPADAVFLLGDVFEVWVGDDAIDVPGSFESACCEGFNDVAQRKALYFMHGNRDFLTGAHFDTSAGTTTLADPTVLVLGGQRLLLSHGDALCLDDTDYQQFRRMARSAAWQQQFLAQPLAKRRRQAQGIRGMDAGLKEKPTNSPIPLEAANGLKNDRGTIAMARTGNPNSATSQFFINVANNDMLNAPRPDGHGYAVFGRVVEGMEVVDKIRAVPTGNRGMHQNVPTTPVTIVSARVIK